LVLLFFFSGSGGPSNRCSSLIFHSSVCCCSSVFFHSIAERALPSAMSTHLFFLVTFFFPERPTASFFLFLFPCPVCPFFLQHRSPHSKPFLQCRRPSLSFSSSGDFLLSVTACFSFDPTRLVKLFSSPALTPPYRTVVFKSSPPFASVYFKTIFSRVLARPPPGSQGRFFEIIAT